jgi:HEAT repeat protein
MVFGLFRSKKEKALQRVLDSNKDNISRIKAFDHLEELARSGDEEAINALLKSFQITVKTDKQEQSLTPYDDEQEKWSIIDRLVGLSDQRQSVLKLLRKDLATPPLLSPGRRDGIVWLIELLNAVLEASSADEEDAAEKIRAELIRALTSFDPEESYREPSRKIELIRALGQHKTPETTAAVAPFLFDVDETVRFRAVETLGTAGDDSASEQLCKVILDDESLRIRQRAAEILTDLNGSIKGNPRRGEIEKLLPPDAKVDKNGVVRRRGS